MWRLKLLYSAVCLSSLCLSNSALAQAPTFSLDLNNGEFYGPGNAVYNDTGIVGINKFPDAQVKNIILTGPLTGVTPFFNNGGEEPNAIAEELSKSGPVDGMASDGTLINENADTALRLNFSDPVSGESADVMVVAEMSDTPDGGEPIRPDAFGNLTFSPDVVADPGDPSLISRFNPVFTTGFAEVPLSLKTQLGEAGGVDAAGPLSAGSVLVGRLGDYDQDGFMDGILVLAENAPLDLIVARGNPIAQRRPWTSDIPLSPDQAIFLTLSGMLNNYPYALSRAEQQFDFVSMQRHLSNLDLGVDAIIGNMRRLLPALDLDSSRIKKGKALIIRNKLKNIRKQIAETASEIDKLGIRNPKDPRFVQLKVQIIVEKTQNVLFSLQKTAEDLGEFFPSEPQS